MPIGIFYGTIKVIGKGLGLGRNTDKKVRGNKCWLAPRDVEPGEAFDMAIKRAIDESCGILLLFCSKSAKSPHVKRELILANLIRYAFFRFYFRHFICGLARHGAALAQYFRGDDDCRNQQRDDTKSYPEYVAKSAIAVH